MIHKNLNRVRAKTEPNGAGLTKFSIAAAAHDLVIVVSRPVTVWLVTV